MTIDPSDLVHDINSKCSNLKRASGLLRGDSSKEELELLALMHDQARSMVEAIAAYEASSRGARRK